MCDVELSFRMRHGNPVIEVTGMRRSAQTAISTFFATAGRPDGRNLIYMTFVLGARSAMHPRPRRSSVLTASAAYAQCIRRHTDSAATAHAPCRALFAPSVGSKPEISNPL